MVLINLPSVYFKNDIVLDPRDEIYYVELQT